MAVVQKLLCRVAEIIDHGSRVYTLLLQPQAPLPRFQNGQFLHLALDAYDPSAFWPDSRPFSIASPFKKRDLLRLSYSVQGAFTARMEAELFPGKTIWVKLPYGEFIIEPHRDAVIFAGGTGITAFSAFIESIDPQSPHKVNLFYGARTPQLLIYQTLIEQTLRLTPNLHVEYYAEENVIDGICPGRLSVPNDLIRRYDLVQPVCYLAGPPEMLKNLSSQLRDQGFPANDIRIDAWS